MTRRRSFFTVLCACVAILCAPAVASAATATFTVSAAGKRALKARSISVTIPRRLTVANDWTIAASARLPLQGSVRFRAGKRRVTASRLELTIGRTASYVSARLGGKTVRLFSVRPTRPAVLDRIARRVSLSGARIALTPAATKRLRAGLKLRRAPSTASLGTVSVAVVAPFMPTPPLPTPTPAPVPIDNGGPAPIAVPSSTPTPTPTPSGPTCAEQMASTPADSVDWFACALPGSLDLKTWTNYLQLPFPAVPGCPATRGSITAVDGAARIVADDPYDHRFPIASKTVGGDGSATIVTAGSVNYAMPAHGIDEGIGEFTIEIAPGGLTGTVTASGHYKVRDEEDPCAAAPTGYSGATVFTLDLSGITPQTEGGVKRWIGVPATIAAGGAPLIGGGTYGAGRPWGSFTIAVPAG